MLQAAQSKNFIIALDEARYYDAHEILEESWFPRRFEKTVPEVILMRGLINAAVSFELLKKGRPIPSLKPWNNYCNALKQLSEIDPDKRSAYEVLIKKIDTLNRQIRV